LFLSVDLVGSTAFKADKQNQNYTDKSLMPQWVSAFTDFYEDFPRLVREKFESSQNTQVDDAERVNFPRRWKTIGDELILCCKVVNTNHLAYVVETFIDVLKSYALHIAKKNSKLSVKGNAWLAACPAPNIGFALDPAASRSGDDLDTTDEIEGQIDLSPHQFDFLGKAIDTGFRIAKNSRHDRCTLSVQLAYLLALARGGDFFKYRLGYDGRMELKGVNEGIPYPIVFIETETDDLQKKLVKAERSLEAKTPLEESNLVDFLSAFMDVASIERPYLVCRGQSLDPRDKPESYLNFEKVFAQLILGLKRQNETIEQGETIDIEDSENRPLDAGLLQAILPDEA
jgi:hypothetical protein